jgi:hypothetical protein
MVKHIDSFSSVEKEKKDERYWLTLFEHAFAMTSRGRSESSGDT